MAGKTLTDNLLRAALDIFGERGFEGASTRAIAQRAGAHQQQITYHFGSKEQLWRAAVDSMFAAFTQQVATRAEGRLEVRLRETLESFLLFSRLNPHFAAITLWERTGDRGVWLEDEVILPMMRQLYRAIFAQEMPALDSPAAMRALTFLLLLCQSATVFTVGTHVDRGFAVDVASDAFFATYLNSVLISLYPLAVTVAAEH